MKLRTLWDDVAAILLIELPHSLRLFTLLLCVLLAYGTGVLWSLAVGYQVDVVRLEQTQATTELRNQIRHLWKSHETMRIRRDWRELNS